MLKDLRTAFSQGGERPGLVEVRHRASLPLPGSPTLLQRGVVELALAAKQLLETHPLGDGRLKEIAIGPAPPHPVEGRSRL
jgi:hypothetical protein